MQELFTACGEALAIQAWPGKIAALPAVGLDRRGKEQSNRSRFP